MANDPSSWKRCSACKKPIDFGADYYVCNVSTCNRKRTAMQFCSVSCWEVHLPVARHREAWAEERTAPTAQQAARDAAAEQSPPPRKKSPRRIIAERSPAARMPEAPVAEDGLREVLIIASRLKDYIRAISGMNTSDRVLEPLSEIVREVAQRAIDNARADERRTVLDRDVPTKR